MTRAARPGTHRFSFFTGADTRQVWAMLTSAGNSTAYFHGFDISTSWRPGAPIRFRGSSDPDAAPPVLTGSVLCVQPRSRLSFYFSSGPGDPRTYTTWELRPSTSGTVVQLQVDQVDCLDTVTDAEDTWLPVLAALQELLSPHGQARPG